MDTSKELSFIAKELTFLKTASIISLTTRLKDNHGKTFYAYIESDYGKQNLKLVEIPGETVKYFDLNKVLDAYKSGNYNNLYLDRGKNWYATGMLKLLKEVKEKVSLKDKENKKTLEQVKRILVSVIGRKYNKYKTEIEEKENSVYIWFYESDQNELDANIVLARKLLQHLDIIKTSGFFDDDKNWCFIEVNLK